MLQRMNVGSQRRGRTRRTPKESIESQIDYSYITTIDPPKVVKVDHHSIEFVWTNLNEADAHGDNRLKYELQEETSKKEFKTVYIGYADTYKVDGLYPLRSYKFRLTVGANDQQLATSSVVSACTSDEPYDVEQLHKAIIKNDLASVQKMIKSKDVSVNATDKFGLTPLMVATQKNYPGMVNLIIELNADVQKKDSSGKNCLMLACFNGNQEVAQTLRDSGLDWDERDLNGSTPLHYAMDSCNRDLVEWAIQDGASIEEKDFTSGWTPLLRCAATTGDVEVSAALLEAGANPNIQDNSGKSALMMSCLNGHLRLTRLLLESGANMYLKSSHGKTCLDMANSFDRDAIVMTLEKAMSM